MHVRPLEVLAAVSIGLDYVEHEYNNAQVGHCKRVALISASICRQLGMSRDDIFDMAACAMLHDSALSAYRRTVGSAGMREKVNLDMHCRGGEAFSRAFPFRGDTSGIVLTHHEHWDGSGLLGRKGTEIPLRGAILALADNMDVRLSLGSGDPSERHRQARNTALKLRGSEYAPAAVDAFTTLCSDAFMRSLDAENLNEALFRVVRDFSAEMHLADVEQLCTVFMNIIDAKSVSTAHHSEGIAHTVETYAHCIGLSEEHVLKLKIAAQLHDVGKLLTPSALLEKPAKLTPAEFEIMKQHAQGTRNILSGIHGMDDIVSWAVNHHEKLDGSGYPLGLTGDALSFECRLMACVDIYQALTEDRVYRPGMDHEKAMHILKELAETGKIDADIVARMESCMI